MHWIAGLVSCLALGAVAAPAPAPTLDNALDKRRDATCTRYPSANKVLTQCQTNTAYCTSFLGRSASTSTVYTKTITKTSTPPVVTVRRTTTTKTFTSTVFTRTTTVTAAPSLTTTTITTTQNNTLTVPTTETTSTTSTSTQTVGDIPCTSVNLKRNAAPEPAVTEAPVAARNALVPPKQSCGMTTFPSATISGACGCLIDQTISTKTTSTLVLSRSLTTTFIPTSGTKTISTVSTTTTTPTSTITETFTSTVTVATITSTVATTTLTSTTTTTETTIQPRCTQGDVNTYDNSDFVSSCGKNFVGYTVDVVDATDMFDCMSACQTYNNYNLPYSCLGISYNSAQCNQNCELKAGIENAAAVDNADYSSARLLSPGGELNGNTCIDGVTQFGDIYHSNGSDFAVLCRTSSNSPNIECQSTPGPDEYTESTCWNACNGDPSCQGASWNTDDTIAPNYGCCRKNGLTGAAYNTPNYPVDWAVRLPLEGNSPVPDPTSTPTGPASPTGSSEPTSSPSFPPGTQTCADGRTPPRVADYDFESWPAGWTPTTTIQSGPSSTATISAAQGYYGGTGVDLMCFSYIDGPGNGGPGGNDGFASAGISQIVPVCSGVKYKPNFAYKRGRYYGQYAWIRVQVQDANNSTADYLVDQQYRGDMTPATQGYPQDAWGWVDLAEFVMPAGITAVKFSWTITCYGGSSAGQYSIDYLDLQTGSGGGYYAPGR